MFSNKVTHTPFRLFCALCTVFIGLLGGRLSFAVQATTSGGDIRVTYYGEVTTFSKLVQKLDTKGIHSALYCANQVTPEVQKRGYGDAKLDSIICFNTATEMKAQGDLNRNIESTVPRSSLPQIAPTQGNSGAGVRPLYGSGFTCVPYTRFALYQYAYNTTFLADICDVHYAENNLQGIGSIDLYGMACTQISGYYGLNHQFWWTNGSTWLSTPDFAYYGANTATYLGSYSC
jgi:hypothetical protein